jgi:hypothetical protein
MPRNLTGGSGHRSQRNSEGAKEKNNRLLVDDLLDDYANQRDTEGVYVGRVTKRMGSGRMEVFYVDSSKNPPAGREQITPMRGGLRGKGKKSVWVDIDSLVMIAETGLAGTTHEIVAVFTEKHVALFKKLMPDADPRLFLKTRLADDTAEDDMFDKGEDEDEDVDVDAI